MFVTARVGPGKGQEPLPILSCECSVPKPMGPLGLLFLGYEQGAGFKWSGWNTNWCSCGLIVSQALCAVPLCWSPKGHLNSLEHTFFCFFKFNALSVRAVGADKTSWLCLFSPGNIAEP